MLVQDEEDNYAADSRKCRPVFGAKFDAVQLHFGEPQTIALSYIEDQDAPELLRKMRIKKKVLAIIAVVMSLILVIWLLATAWAIADAKQTTDGHIGEDITIVE